MTRLDERASVPPLDAARRARLAVAIDRDGVVAGMLIGSQARGDASALADVDVAVWLEPGLTATERRRLRARLHGACASAVGTDEVDLVALNEAPPLLRHRALRDRVLLVDRDHDERVRLEVRSILDYLDTKPLRAAREAGIQARLDAGTYGRP